MPDPEARAEASDRVVALLLRAAKVAGEWVAAEVLVGRGHPG
jgi:hypothetical protein